MPVCHGSSSLTTTVCAVLVPSLGYVIRRYSSSAFAERKLSATGMSEPVQVIAKLKKELEAAERRAMEAQAVRFYFSAL